MIFVDMIQKHEAKIIKSYESALIEAEQTDNLEDRIKVWKRHAQLMGSMSKSTKMNLLCEYVRRLKREYGDRYDITYRVVDDLLVKTVGRSIDTKLLIELCKTEGRPTQAKSSYHTSRDIRMELLNSDIVSEMAIDYQNIENWLKGFKTAKNFRPEIKAIIERDQKRRNDLINMQQKKSPAETEL